MTKVEEEQSSRLPRADAYPSSAGEVDRVLSVDGVSRTYGPVRALRPFSLELRAGEVHALVGENGSGKSTLVGILSGTVRPDAGTVRIDGARLRHFTPWESQRAGVITVFQDGTVIGDLSVAQNLYLGVSKTLRPAFSRVNSWAAERLDHFGLSRLNPRCLLNSLPPGDAQLFDIVRAIISSPRVLLLDEATSALDSSGVDMALELVQRAAHEGAAVLFVTHRLSEVFRVADRVSVLRDGEYQGTNSASALSTAELVEKMAGASVTLAFPPRAESSEIRETLLAAHELRGTTFGPI
ncbi:MAG: ATP-binding cassette domain-containing protein, partial [Acidimicrobiales bacterium]